MTVNIPDVDAILKGFALAWFIVLSIVLLYGIFYLVGDIVRTQRARAHRSARDRRIELPSGIIEFTGTLSDAEREELKREWMRLFTGPGEAPKFEVLP